MPRYDAQQGRNSAPEADLSAAQRDADNADLHVGLTGVACLVAGERTVVALLEVVATFAARAIPGADGAGAALLSHDDCESEIPPRAATTAVVAEIDAVQYDELNEGPCLATMESGRPTVSGSLGADDRWPRFGGRVARLAMHSALSLPLVVDQEVIGVIGAYAGSRDTFGEHAVEIGVEFARTAAVSIYNVQLLAEARERTTRLQRALSNRPMIDQAIGIIRSRSGGTADEAFEKLTTMSQDENVKLHIVAERLVDEAVRRARALRLR